KALKVAFAAGDSFGTVAGANKNWKRFALFRFDALNPAATPVKLELTVVHARSTSYQTRVVMPIKLRPGRNEVKIGIDEMTNVNGSAPALDNVIKWYINDADSKSPTPYFRDICREGGDARPAGAAPGGPQPLIGYKIKGKVGTLDVDLTVTPFIVGTAPGGGKPSPVRGDPARLKRIQAAKMPALAKPVLFHTPEAD